MNNYDLINEVLGKTSEEIQKNESNQYFIGWKNWSWQIDFN